MSVNVGGGVRNIRPREMCDGAKEPCGAGWADEWYDEGGIMDEEKVWVLELYFWRGRAHRTHGGLGSVEARGRENFGCCVGGAGMGLGGVAGDQGGC